MSIILKNSQNIPPARWGSFEDVQYAIRVNAEKIYGIDPDSNKLLSPMFWGFPLIDYSENNVASLKSGLIYKNNSLFFVGNNSDRIYLFKVFDTPTEGSILIRFRSNIINTTEQRLIAYNGDGVFAIISINGGTNNLIRGYCKASTGGGWSDTTTAYNVKTVHNIVITFKSNDYLRLYVDENLIGTPTALGTLEDLGDEYGRYIGAGRLGISEFANGYLENVYITTDVFTQEQISKFNEFPYGLYQKVIEPIYYFTATPAVGWTGKINTVTNPAKINGVAVANITKVLGH